VSFLKRGARVRRTEADPMAGRWPHPAPGSAATCEELGSAAPTAFGRRVETSRGTGMLFTSLSATRNENRRATLDSRRLIVRADNPCSPSSIRTFATHTRLTLPFHEGQHVARRHLVPFPGDDLEEHLQVERGRQHGVRANSSGHEPEVVIQHRMPQRRCCVRASDKAWHPGRHGGPASEPASRGSDHPHIRARRAGCRWRA